MKIAMVGSKGVPATHGGVERVIEELGSRLVEQGHQVLVYCRPYYTGGRVSTHRGMKLRHLPSIETKHLDTITHSALSVLHVIMCDRPDVVHVHSLGNTPLLAPLRMLGIPTVLHIHGMEWKMAKWGAGARTYFRLCHRMIPWFPDRVVTVAEVWTRDLERSFPALRPRTVVNGVTPLTSGDPANLAPFGLEPGQYLVFMGRLAPQKGCHHLVDAFRSLDTRLKLAIVGGPDDTEDYERDLRRRAEGDDRIVFTGYQYGGALTALLGHARLYVHPSDSEGLSLALLEAMSAGRPVLASDIPENREALGSTGEYFERGDPASLGAQLAAMLAREDLGALGERARERAHLHFSWEAAVRSLLVTYEEVIAARVPEEAA